jgi:hypothetical protein
MTADERRLTYTERQQEKQKREEQARRAQYRETAERLARMSDGDLIASAPGYPGPHHEMEMQRRLKYAVEALTAETIASRQSSERLTARLDASIASLTQETVRARESSERVGRRLIWLTVVLVLLTAALVALPFVQAATDHAPAPAPSHSAR